MIIKVILVHVIDIKVTERDCMYSKTRVKICFDKFAFGNDSVFC